MLIFKLISTNLFSTIEHEVQGKTCERKIIKVFGAKKRWYTHTHTHALTHTHTHSHALSHTHTLTLTLSNTMIKWNKNLKCPKYANMAIAR